MSHFVGVVTIKTMYSLFYSCKTPVSYSGAHDVSTAHSDAHLEWQEGRAGLLKKQSQPVAFQLCRSGSVWCWGSCSVKVWLSRQTWTQQKRMRRCRWTGRTGAPPQRCLHSVPVHWHLPALCTVDQTAAWSPHRPEEPEGQCPLR